jgi:hypothetical protein
MLRFVCAVAEGTPLLVDEPEPGPLLGVDDACDPTTPPTSCMSLDCPTPCYNQSEDGVGRRK